MFLSKNHTHLDSCPTCSEYWDFGLHEQAIFDYSAVIDYLLNNTQSSQLDFIGYSMGTTQVTKKSFTVYSKFISQKIFLS